MPEPFRLRLQSALTARLEEITTTDGGVSMAGRVFRGRALFGDDDPLPMISILEEAIPEDQIEAPREGQSSHGNYRLLIQGFVEDDHQNPTDPAHYLLADVKAKLAEVRSEEHDATGLFHLGRKSPTVMSLEFGPGIVRPPDDEISAKAYFWLSVSMGLVEDHSNPYA